MWAVSDAIAATPVDLEFVRPTGTGLKISFQSFLFALGDTASEALHNMQMGKVR
jgi:hypothetical protein